MNENKRSKGTWIVLGFLVLAMGVLVGACGGDDESSSSDTKTTATTAAASGEPIKIGILSDCEGAFGAFYEPDIGGAQAPLIARGAKAKGKKPSDGLTGIKIAGQDAEIVGYGCADDTADKAIEETRRLMEQEDADILIGPLSGDEGIAVANYAKDNPDKTFINGTSGAQDTTLKVQAPNFFRFHSDGAQWSAGLGDYAYNELGWRTAATIGDDYSFPYTSLAGFIAEFCSLGGKVTKRVWPPLNEKDYSSFVAQIPKDVDGLMVGIGGAGLINFVKQYEQTRGQIDGKKTMGNVFFDDPLVLKEVGDDLVGAYTAGPTAADDPGAQSYVDVVDKAYGPAISDLASSVFVYNYYNAMEGLISGLESVKGDISDQKKLQAALEGVSVDGAWGQVKLDENRNGIADNYVKQLVKGDKGVTVKTIAKVPAVDQTFGGTFSADTPAPDRTNPKCEKGEPPAWAGKAEPVEFGS